MNKNPPGRTAPSYGLDGGAEKGQAIGQSTGNGVTQSYGANAASAAMSAGLQFSKSLETARRKANGG